MIEIYSLNFGIFHCTSYTSILWLDVYWKEKRPKIYPSERWYRISKYVCDANVKFACTLGFAHALNLLMWYWIPKPLIYDKTRVLKVVKIFQYKFYSYFFEYYYLESKCNWCIVLKLIKSYFYPFHQPSLLQQQSQLFLMWHWFSLKKGITCKSSEFKQSAPGAMSD